MTMIESAAFGRSFLFQEVHTNLRPSMLSPSPCIHRSVLFSSLSQQINKFSTKLWRVDPFTGVVESATAKLQVVVGLEIHAQLNISTKLFSASSLPSINSRPNTCLNGFDLSLPGSLPVLSCSAVRAAVLIAAALQCDIAGISRFERKHYAFADLPSGYQITQQRWPIARNGLITSRLNRKKNIEVVNCRVTRIQLEQDTGKTVTAQSNAEAENDILSSLDFNRAGAALVEIVTEPDLRSSAAAGSTVETVLQLLQHTKTCLGKMEVGQFRIDANVNVVRCDLSDGVLCPQHASSPRVEVKNLNSIKQVRDCINYEARRQGALFFKQPETLLPETRTWNASTHQTELIRSKDGEENYRFVPEPDIPPIVLNEKVLGSSSLSAFIGENLPELPGEAVSRLQKEYGISEYQASVIAADPPAISFFETAASKHAHSKKYWITVANLLSNELYGLVKASIAATEALAEDMVYSVENSTVSAEQLGELALLQHTGQISSTMAKKILEILFVEEKGACPHQVATDRGFQMISTVNELRILCHHVMKEDREKVDIYLKGGKYARKMEKYFVGKAMAASHGNAHPERLREVLAECLEQESR